MTEPVRGPLVGVGPVGAFFHAPPLLHDAGLLQAGVESAAARQESRPASLARI
jgi:hypothetical protein